MTPFFFGAGPPGVRSDGGGHRGCRVVNGLFVFEGVVGGAYRLVEVVAVRWSLRRPAWMRLRMV